MRMAMQVESYLSRALAVNVVRRHSRGGADSSDGFHYGPAVRIVTGNYVTGKRRGVVDGVDFGATGSGMLCPASCSMKSARDDNCASAKLCLGHVIPYAS